MGSLELHDRLSRARLMSQPVERYGGSSGMIETGENLARDYGITREQSDAYSVRSHQRAAAAWRGGKFDDEIVPVAVPQKRGAPVIFDRDEGYREDASLETLAALRPIAGGFVKGTTTSQTQQVTFAALACRPGPPPTS